MSLIFIALQGWFFIGSDVTEPTILPNKVVSVGLFKNGFAVVKREVTLPGPGSYQLEQVPEPVHGTFWINSSKPIETMVKMQEVEVDLESSGPIKLVEDIEGKRVTIHLQGEKIEPIVGTVLSHRKTLTLEDVMEEPYMPYTSRGYAPPSVGDDFLIVQTAKRRVYLRLSQITYVEVEGADKVKRKKPVLTLTVPAPTAEPVQATVTYLARGLSWAPSYHVDISDPKQLKIEQAAVVRNELMPFQDAEVYLISGFPSIQFSNVTSPLAARTSWNRFFQELNQRDQGYRGAGRQMMSQMAITMNAPQIDFGYVEGGTAAFGDGIDLHYQSIGKRQLKQGDALSLSVAKADANYERIVEWLIPDHRDEFGNYHNRSVDDDGNLPWDAMRFKNPFSFPMTTGPAFVTSNGKFGGQRLSAWVNSGEETLLRVNKALSLRTRSTEVELQTSDGAGGPGGRSNREEIWIGGKRFRQSRVEGEIVVSNHRKESVNLMVRRRFSGDLEKADGEPKVTLREEGVWSVNRRNEMVWNIKLQPGEGKKLKYQYTVLIAW